MAGQQNSGAARSERRVQPSERRAPRRRCSFVGSGSPPPLPAGHGGVEGGVEGGVPAGAVRARCPGAAAALQGPDPLLQGCLRRDSASAGRGGGVAGGQRPREPPGLREEGPAVAGGGAGGHTSLSPASCLRGAEDGGAGGPATAAVVGVRREGTGPDRTASVCAPAEGRPRGDTLLLLPVTPCSPAQTPWRTRSG